MGRAADARADFQREEAAFREIAQAPEAAQEGASEALGKALADGRIFSGRQAKDAGLVDELGDSNTAAELAGKLGGITGTPKIRRDSDPIKEIFQMLDSRLPGQLLGALRNGPPHLLEYRWAGW